MTFNTSNLSLFEISLAFSNEKGHFDYPSLSQDFEWKHHLEMVFNLSSIDQIMTEKKYFSHLMTLFQMVLASLTKTIIESSEIICRK